MKKAETILFFVLVSLAMCIQAKPQSLYKVNQINSAGEIDQTAYISNLQNNPENVLVLYNLDYSRDENANNIWDGYEIAAYYCEKRTIPSSNLIGITAPTQPDISRAQYDSYYADGENNIGIRQQIENILDSKRDEEGKLLRSKIKYIVLTKGIPHRIKTYQNAELWLQDYGSVDAAVAMIFNGNYEIKWYVINPYYNQDHEFQGTAPFIPEFYSNGLGQRLSFLVTRLDGYSVADVKQVIDRAVRTGTSARNYTFILDDAQKTYDRMALAHQKLSLMGANVFPDPWQDDLEHILSYPDSVIGIVTHGVHAGLQPDYILNQYNFDLANGAIFSSYESFNGVSFTPEIQTTQGQISDFIRIGGSGGIGNVYEPQSSAIANEAILFPAYYTGYTFAEAAYMSLPYIDWTAIVIGDPLMRVGPEISPKNVDNFRIISISPPLNSDRQGVTTVAEIVFSQVIDTLRLPRFTLSPGGTELQRIVRDNYLYLWAKETLPQASFIRFQSTQPLYSAEGDSLLLTNYAFFATHLPGGSPSPPSVHHVTPSGIAANQNSDIEIVFSQKMIPASIYPILGDNDIQQEHIWQDDRVLTVKHDPLLAGTYYSFYIDEHAKSVDGLSLEKNFHFSFETEFNCISFDIDNDHLPEYIYNHNHSLLDGYEKYEDPGGINTSVLYSSDLNSDHQKEFFIRKGTNGHPTWFWDANAIPYTGYVAQCVPLDDDDDGTMEYAFDSEGIGYFDKVYDPDILEKIRDIQFSLIRFFPSDQARDVSSFASIVLDFSIPIRLDRLLDHIHISPSIDQIHIRADLNGRKIMLTPLVGLELNTKYEVRIDNNLPAIDQKLLPHDYFFTFTTGSTILPADPPHILSFYPGDSLFIADNTPTVRFIFSQPMDIGFITPVITDTTDVVHWAPYWSDELTLYLVPLDQLEADKKYSFTIDKNFCSSAGKKVTGKRNFNFIAGNNSDDKQQPSILEIIPPGGSVLTSGASVNIIFSEWLSTDPDQWIEINSQDDVQKNLWHVIGKSLFTFKGDPGWLPQRQLSMNISSKFARDHNQNTLIQDYRLEYLVLGQIITRDVDKDGVLEYVVDGDQDLSNGFEIYQDPGGITTKSVFIGDMDNDGFNDFIITGDSEILPVAWFAARSDSGDMCYAEQIDDSLFEVSVDADDLTELLVNIFRREILPVIPRLRTFLPQNGSFDIPLFMPITLSFNTQMEPFSVLQSIHINPSTAGKWSHEIKSSKLVFHPETGWQESTIYTFGLDGGYHAQNNQSSNQSLEFTFRTSLSQNNTGDISWQFPQEGDSVHSQSDYYILFNMNTDTTVKPKFEVIQKQKIYTTHATWLTDILLRISVREPLNPGEARLTASGNIHYLSAPPMQLNRIITFIVEDNLEPKVVRCIQDISQPVALNIQLPFIFNQPLDGSSLNKIILTAAGGGNNNLIPIVIDHDKNYLEIKSRELKYEMVYDLTFKTGLFGISGRELTKDNVYSFQTEKNFVADRGNIYWAQNGNYLTLSWLVTPVNAATYQLYLSQTYTKNPDTLSRHELFGSSDRPTWLLNTEQLPEKSYLYIRVLKEQAVWSFPLIVFNVENSPNNPLSFPVTMGFTPAALPELGNSMVSLSQWDSEIKGWKSTKYSREPDQWLPDITIRGNSGLLVRSRSKGSVVWVQVIADSQVFHGTEKAQGCFYSLYNPFGPIKASSLSVYFGNAIRLVRWENKKQGWNEAIFDPDLGRWINDFEVANMDPVYLYTSNGFSVTVNSNQLQPPPQTGEYTQYTNSNHFPSYTKLIKFNTPVYLMEITRNGIKQAEMVGCGIDNSRKIAYINTGNLDEEDAWQINFYDEYGNRLSSYEYGREADGLVHVPNIFKLDDPFPNPFNAEITLPIQIPGTGKVTVKIYNILGQLVKEDIIQANMPKKYMYKWQARVASGMYILQVNYNHKLYTKKVCLVK
jgi:uncharacterized protein (TIGR03790 family)